MTFGEKLQSVRKKAGMSQDALAERLEVSRQAVSKWERDEAMPESEKVVRIAKLFGVSLDELLMDKKETPEPQPRYEPPRYQESGEKLERFLRRHGYKFGYAMMAVGAVICVFAILMRLVWPSLVGNFFDTAMPDSFGTAGWEIQIEGDVPDSVKQEIAGQLMGDDALSGFYGSAADQMSGMMNNAVNTQANLFLIALLPGMVLLIGGIIIVVKGKKLAVQEW